MTTIAMLYTFVWACALVAALASLVAFAAIVLAALLEALKAYFVSR